jgi:hypothetical protein
LKVLLFQLDGKMPNLALMRITAHHRERGDDVELRVAGNFPAVERQLGESCPDKVYASSIFSWTRDLAARLQETYPGAIVGGSGWDTRENITQLWKVGITTKATDYSLYPNYPHSIGFTQRGCRMNEIKCSFCSVPWREGKNRAEASVIDIWRGDPWPKNLLLLDNDTFGNPNWKQEIEAIRDGGFKVCWNQGINARLLTRDEFCEAIASVDYRDDQFKIKRLYTAWDNIGDEKALFSGLERLTRYGVKPDNIMVYMLIGHEESAENRELRRKKLRDFGVRPYPMPYVRTQELIGFQRWIVGAYDKRITWADWKAAEYRPEKLGLNQVNQEVLQF